MVAGQNHTRSSADGYPTGGLKCLCSLVDEESAELLALHDTTVGPHQRRGDDPCFAEKFAIDAYLQFGGTAFQSFQLLMVALSAASFCSTATGVWPF